MVVRAVLLLLLVGCRREAPPDETDPGDTEDSEDTETDPPPDTGEPWWGADPDDVDGDGLSAGHGDCDDADPTVSVRHSEVCDGKDNDCDGEVDELDAPDDWEPNDVSGANLGVLTPIPETLLLGFLHPTTDVDRYAFYVEDEDFGYFDVEAWLYGVPVDADYQLELLWTADSGGANRGSVAFADAGGQGATS